MVGAITENIALLAVLAHNGKIESPTDNPIPATLANSAHRILSIRREKDLAEAFAVLLATTDDPSRVGAICVEERPNKDGLVIRSAVNSGSQEERLQVSKDIARVLARISGETRLLYLCFDSLLIVSEMDPSMKKRS